MNRQLLGILVCCLLLALGKSAGGQELLFNEYSRLLSPEKLYLMTDREVYSVGDTVWFSGYLQNASRRAEYDECNFIYVELISKRWEPRIYKNRDLEVERVRSRVKVKRFGNVFAGYLPLKEDLNSGVAVLRAYSYWMLNSSPAYMFNKNIMVCNPMKDQYLSDLETMDHPDLALFHDVGVPGPAVRSDVTRCQSEVELSFFPESGRYFWGVRSRIAVRSTSNGAGLSVSGNVYADGNEVASFRTDAYGYGVFDVTVPLDTKELFASFRQENGNADGCCALPFPEDEGVTIRLDCDDDGCGVTLDSRNLDFSEGAWLLVNDRTEVYYQALYRGGEGYWFVPRDLLKPGISTVSVANREGVVLAQRSFFVYPELLRGEIVASVGEYSPRIKVKVSSKITDMEGRALSGVFSASVTDEEWSPNSGTGYDIMSWMWIGSEYAEHVEGSHRFFDGNIPLHERKTILERVMLTYGWTYYNLREVLVGKNPMPTYGKEYMQSLSGYVNGPFGKARHSLISFAAPSINYYLVGEIDSTAYFTLNCLDFPEGTNFIVGAQGTKKVLEKLYTPILNPELYAADYSYPYYLPRFDLPDELEDRVVTEYYGGGGELHYALQPSRISAEKTSKLTPIPGYEFKNGHYRSGDALQPYALEPLSDYVAMTCPECVNMGGIPTCRSVYGSVRRDVVLYVNGVLAGSPEDHYGWNREGASLQMSDIESFGYVTGLEASRFCVTMDDMTNPGMVVFVRTKRMVLRAPNVSIEKPMGWQKPARMYDFRYKTPSSRKAYEPVRSTLYWNPSLTFKNGVAEFEFWTSDHKAPYRITIEGIASDGTPVLICTRIF